MARNNRRQFSDEERIAYRKKRRMLRRIQIFAELGAILLVIVVAAFFVVGKLNNKESVTADNGEATEETETSSEETASDTDTFSGLKPSANASADPSISQEDEASTEEEEVVEPLFSASENSDTLTIDLGDVISPYAILINNDSDTVVATKNAYDKIIPASMTKIMTVYTAAKHIDADKLDDTVTLSKEAVDYCYASGCSTSGFVEGETVTVRDLFYGTILPSGGDAATQLAMYVSGDVDSFTALMNEEVKKLGLSETTHFSNPIGFYTEDNYSTCYDIAMIMEAALEDEFCSQVLTTKVYYSTATNINPEGIVISNWFLRRIEDKSFGGTINGAKTGYVDESGSCAASSETADSGTHYICVTAKSTSSWNCIADHVAIYSSYAK